MKTRAWIYIGIVAFTLLLLMFLNGCSTMKYMSDNGVERARVNQNGATQREEARSNAKIAMQQAKSRAEEAKALMQYQTALAMENGRTERQMNFHVFAMTSLTTVTTFAYVVVALVFLLASGAMIMMWLQSRQPQRPVNQLVWYEDVDRLRFVTDPRFDQFGWKMVEINGQLYGQRRDGPELQRCRLIEDKHVHQDSDVTIDQS